MNGFYDLKNPKSLYEKAKIEQEKFCQNPNDYDLFNLITTLYHLREWIYPDKYESYKHLTLNDLSEEQKLHKLIFEDSNYKIIQALANNSKHFNNIDTCNKTKITNGFIMGFSQFGDSLGKRNYIYDGKDMKVIISEVFRIYDDYFKFE